MKSHAQIMREYNLSPLLPTMKPIMKPIHAAAPVSTNATTYSASPVGKHIGDTLMMIAVFMLTLMTGSAAPIPLY
ncbi:hypothetical protein AGMMS49992_28100 [Clostridia bacterium]|nr:hypothetical protein AGMMS49992_28100 [Clostridia bacterium]